MSKFYPGQRVVCVDVSDKGAGRPSLSVGGVYTVKEQTGPSNVWIHGCAQGFFPDRFRALAGKVFEVGQRVVCVCPLHGTRPGEVHTVAAIGRPGLISVAEIPESWLFAWRYRAWDPQIDIEPPSPVASGAAEVGTFPFLNPGPGRV